MLQILLGAVLFLIVALVTRELLRHFDPKLPPGPWGLPILGYSPFLSNSAYKDYVRLQRKYGPVFGFYIGIRYMVVLGDYEAIKEAYNKEEFLDRPGNFKFSEHENNIISMNGWEWKESRRFVLSTLRTLGMGKNKVEERIKEEVAIDLNKLEEMGPDAEVNTEEFFYRAFANIIFSIISGLNLEEGDSVLNMVKRFKDALFGSVPSVALPYFFPVLKIVNFILRRSFNWDVISEDVNKYMKEEIASHEKNFDPSQKEDFIDYYLEEMRKKKGKKTSITYSNLIGNGKVLLFAATETTQASLDWILLCLAQYPDMQEKVYVEILDLLGKERAPSWNDKDSLPYTNAFLMEVQRYKTVAPADDPHWSSNSGTISGHYIPKDVTIVANIYAVHMDEKLWGDPENFRPERFLSPDGKLMTPEYWMPFLIGKRMCPGEKLAVMQLFLIVTSIVQRFKVVPPKSGLSLEENKAVLLNAAKPIVSFRSRQ